MPSMMYFYQSLEATQQYEPVDATLLNKPTRHITGLEFIHITKTAGSSIEATAAKFGTKWGACHWKQISSFGKACMHRDKSRHVRYNHKRIPFDFKEIFAEPWHTPHHWFYKNPYANNATFCVVRNPYDRVVSEYFCRWGGYRGKKNKNSAVTMNEYIQQKVRKSIQNHRGAHFLPQHMYVYNKQEEKVVDHVLRFENLNDDFSALMNLYDLPIELPQKKNARNMTKSILTVANLTEKTIQVINEVYEQDFNRFGYQQVRGPDEFDARL